MMNKSFMSGIISTAIGKYSNTFFQLIITGILARLLTPDEYGIVAVVTVFIVFFTMFGEMGIGPAIIQNKELEDKDYSEIFTFTVVLGLILGLIFIILGFPASMIYGNNVYQFIFFLLSFVVFFNVLAMVPRAMLLKEKRFFWVNIVVVIANILSGIVSIYLAYSGWSYYSLVIGNVIKVILIFLLLFFPAKIKIVSSFSKETIKKIYYFSKNQFVYDFATYFAKNLDNLLIGVVISKESLAFYDKAYQLSLAPNQMLTRVVTPVVQPILSDFQHDLERIKKTYYRMFTLFFAFGMPLSTYLFLFSKEIILVLYGNQWGESIIIFKIFALSTGIQMLTTIAPVFFQSINRPDLLRKYGVYSALLSVGAILFGLFLKSIVAIALLLVVSFFICLIIAHYYLSVEGFKTSFFEIFWKQKKNFSIFCAVSVLLLVVKYCIYIVTGSPFLIVGISGALFAISMLFILRILKDAE